ncbi:hypothetical protein PVAP13_3KG200600 [Panicum virgatum]|uniref:Uncharacterized protein n=1 Tax=Panicum virgatum TaxID=38727 RepID=A0A8T0UWT1_PANVG|nr:hypothetical protein PVAP13_3KG200600 [Panicum virgatum]
MLLASSSSAVVSMNGSGEGDTSYANNSNFQRVIASVTRKARRDMAAALYCALGRPASLAIADLGCGTGPNALLMVSDAVDAVLAETNNNKGASAAPLPQLHVFLNDLPANDFNAVFRLLPSSPLAAAGCLVSAWPGSFYRRLFPEASLDYVVSSSSLHFLSKAPPMAPEHLNRSARPTAHDCYLWDLLADALMDMAAAGLVDEERVHSFNAPYYAPCPDDLARVVAEEGSFAIRTMHLFDTTRCHLLAGGGRSHPPTSNSNKHDGEGDDELPRWLAAETAATIKAVVEPMLRTHFGWAAMDGLFCRYRLLLEAYYRSKATRNKDDITNVFLVLEKKQRCY